jgi:hypothetical protein
VMAVTCRLWLVWLGGLPSGFPSDLLRVATTVTLGAGIFYLVGRALGLTDLERLTSHVRRSLRR